MNYYAADMHIHTALSPCAAREMTPEAIVHKALERNLAILAVCDHNAAGNAWAVQQAAGDELTVLAGIEITTSEEAHILGLFPDYDTARGVADKVRSTLPDADIHSPHFEGQYLLDEKDHVAGREGKMLVAASAYSLSEAIRLIHDLGGLAFASHIDRPSFSVLSQLGILPPDASFDALEISAAGVAASRMKYFSLYGLPLVTSSDSHCLSDIGSCVTFLEAPEPNFRELALALKGVGGRRCFIA